MLNVRLAAEQYNSTWNEKMSDFKLRMFDVYNGMFTVSHWHTGENCTNRFAPLNKVATTGKKTIQQKHLNDFFSLTVDVS